MLSYLFDKELGKACGGIGVAQIRRRILTALAIALVTMSLAGMCQSVPRAMAGSGSQLADVLLRLHVIANSDTFEDQALKLKVRDAVLDAAGEILEGVTSKEEAMALICSDLDRLETAAVKAVEQEGYTYSITVSCGTFAFPDRSYGSLFVPAGDYDAIRVIIGTGRGSNWWCVMFPPLCFIDVSGNQMETQASAAPVDEHGSSTNTHTVDTDDDRRRLEKQVQNYVSSLEHSTPTAGAESVDTGRKGLIARLEGEIGRIKQQLGSQKYAIQSLLWFF